VVVLGVAGFALAPAILEGCSQTGVGDPCTPEQEYDPTFNGFDPGEVNVESKSFQCQTRLCLVNHFQGRVSCPYGQSATCQPTENNGAFYNDTNSNPIIQCGIPGSVPIPSAGAPAEPLACNDPTDKTWQSEPITGDPTVGSKSGALVQPQCLNRTADKAVYCSCRCANTAGNTNDGANYCSCPEGYSCTQLVSSTGPTDTGLTGAYCIKSGTDYNTSDCPSTLLGSPISVPACDPSKANCGSYNGQ
jgi:hypothetical protein